MPDNELDPQDVIASSGVIAVARGVGFLAACFGGHGLGIFAAAFHEVSDLIPGFGSPSFGGFGAGVFGSFGPALFGVIFYWWLAPWLLALVYFGSQFFLVEGAWQRWLPWVIGGQAIYSFIVSDGGGVGYVIVLLTAGAVFAGWKLLEAKLYERTMRRFDEIEAENRAKRRRKRGQGEDSRTQ